MLSKLNLIIADDHDVFLDGMEPILKANRNVNTIYRAYNGQEALDLMHKAHVDLLITDINMQQMNGIELIKSVKQQFPNTFIMVITDYYDIEHIKPLICHNVHVILDKQSIKKNFKKALKALQDNKSLYSGHVSQTVKIIEAGNSEGKDASNLPKLSQKELAYLKPIASGKSNDEIAREVFRSPNTVDTHRSNLYSKFSSASGEKINNAAKLASIARSLGFLTD